MVPAAAALGLVALVRLRGRALAAFLLVARAAALGFACYYSGSSASPSPFAIYGGLPPDAQVVPWRALAGLLLDRSFGLLPSAPVFLLALAGLPSVLRGGTPGPTRYWPCAILAPRSLLAHVVGRPVPAGAVSRAVLPFLGAALALRLTRGRAACGDGCRASGWPVRSSQAVAVARPARCCC